MTAYDTGTAGLFFFLNQSLFVARVLRCERYDVHGNTGEDHSLEHSLSAAAAAGQSTAPKEAHPGTKERTGADCALIADDRPTQSIMFAGEGPIASIRLSQEQVKMCD